MFEEDAHYTRARAKRIAKKIAAYTVLVLISIIWLIPFVYLFVQSFGVAYDQTRFIPAKLTFNNYVLLFTDKTYPFWKWWTNTLVIALATAVIQTLIVLMTSYALSRLRFRMRKPLMKFMLILGMFPGFLSMIVIYKLLQFMHLETSLVSLLIIYIGGAAMQYYISKGFFDTVSHSLDEAAMIDGANKNTIFFRIILPLSKPIIIYTILIAFTAPWGDYMMASFIAQGRTNMFTVAVGLQQWLSKLDFATYFNRFCAGGVLTSIPIMVLFFWLQKYYVSGVTGGAVKG